MTQQPQTRVPRFVPETVDQRVELHRIGWAGYETLLEVRGERSAPRIAYLDGTMELMSPSRDHDRIAAYLGHLVFAYAMERDIDLSPYRSWTIRAEPKTAGIEADECFIIGDQNKERPDLAIEVVWTSGGLDKLEIYRRLGVPEVWFWRAGVITVQVLDGGAYEQAPSSRALPGIVLTELVSYLEYPTAIQAVRAYRAALAVKP